MRLTQPALPVDTEIQRLRLVRHPKPWGEEVWHGNEALQSGLALRVKTLCSSPQLERGELYHELHRHKWECYRVTTIDRKVWPFALAPLRLGANQELLRQRGRARFMQEYAAALAAYERLAAAAGDNVATCAATKAAKTAAERYAGVEYIGVGDWVVIPPGYAHGLPAGVEVLEFQDCTQERLVLSFNQPLWTQSGWDREEALQHFVLEPLPTGYLSRPLHRTQTCCSEPRTVAVTPRFTLSQLQLRSGAAVELQLSNTVIVCSSGAVELDGVSLAAGEAVRVNCGQGRVRALAVTRQGAEIVIAMQTPGLVQTQLGPVRGT